VGTRHRPRCPPNLARVSSGKGFYDNGSGSAEMMLRHTSVLSPDAGCLASVVSKVPFARDSTVLPYPTQTRRPVPSPASGAISDVTGGFR
jgi:hypothetical protein